MHEYRLKHSTLALAERGRLTESNNLSRKITGFKMSVNILKYFYILYLHLTRAPFKQKSNKSTRLHLLINTVHYFKNI